MSFRIAITAGYSRSLHAIALIHALAARGHTIALCIQVRAMQVARLRGYLRQIGPRKLMAKVLAKLFPTNKKAGFGGEVAAMQVFFEEQNISSRTVADACRAVGAQHLVVSNLNDAAVSHAVRAAHADLVIYAGGGIVRRELLQSTKLGVLNAHGGPLPRFRGMNAAEWALLHGIAPTVTIHWMNDGIDTGPILFERPIPLTAWRSIPNGRGAATRVSVEALLEAVDMLADGPVPAMPQEAEAGRQYHVMADPLLEVLEARLAALHSNS